jgi:hypothetical protein
VIRCDDLRKVARLGAIGRVATHAQNCRIQLGRLDRRGILGVLSEGPVAGFAVHMGVLPLAFHLENIGMARLAGLVSGEGHGSRRNFSDGISAVMSILAKTAWDQDGAQNYEYNDSSDEDQGHAEQVFDILEPVHGAMTPAHPRNAE